MKTRRWPAIVPALLAGSLIASAQLGGIGKALPLYIYSKVADLSITETASVASVAPGQQFVYQITLRNSGPDRAPTVAMTDQLPPDVTFGSCTTGSFGTCTESNGLVRASYASLGQRVAPLIKIVVTVDPSAFNGLTITNTAHIQSLAFDPDLGNNAASAAVTVTHPCDGTWVGQFAPRVESFDFLSGISAVSPADVWAVGTENIPNRTRHGFIEHWDGTAWSVVPSPLPGTSDVYLTDVSASSSLNVWAIGYYLSNRRWLPFTERWNGSAWHLVPVPSVPRASLSGVFARARNDVWAVGSQAGLGGYASSTLIEHWDGTSWSALDSPDLVSGSNGFGAVWAASVNDAWAVGSAFRKNRSQSRTLIEHWNGVSWSIVPSPNPRGPGFTDLNAAFGTSESDVWAAGTSSPSGSEIEHAVIEHWDGSAWKLVPSPSFRFGEELLGVTALSSTDAWAAGFRATRDMSKPLTEHWNGSRWNLVPNPDLPGPADLPAISADSSRDVWAAGELLRTPNKSDPLIERLC